MYTYEARKQDFVMVGGGESMKTISSKTYNLGKKDR